MKLWPHPIYSPVGEEDVVTLSDCRIIDLPRIEDPLGNLTYIEERKEIPFPIKRIYYLYDVPGGASRGGHAHKRLHQFIIAPFGSFEVILDDGSGKKIFFLNRAYYGLYIPPMIWREIDNFSSGSICMALVSRRYEEEDYIRNYDDFLAQIRNAQV